MVLFGTMFVGCGEAKSKVVELKTLSETKAVVEKYKGLLILDFFGSWCPSCIHVEKSLAAVKEKLGEKVAVYKVEHSKRDIFDAYEVKGVPHVAFFKDGKKAYSLDGLCTTKDYLKVATDLIKKGVVDGGFVPEKHQQSLGLSVEQALGMMENANPVILDVRTPYEFSQGYIEGAIHIPLNELSQRLDELKDKKKEKIIVYCLSGFRSGRACKLMAKQGYTVFNLGSGIGGWQGAGQKVVKD